MTKWLDVLIVLIVAVVVGAALLVAGELPALAADEVFLATGGYVTGDLEEADLTLQTPSATYRVTRESVWRVALGTGPIGDLVELRNGNHLSGRIDRARYTLRLPGGETRTLNRDEIAEIKLGAPSRRTATPRLTDVVLLQNGDYVFGDLSGSEFTLALPTGTQRFHRDRLWRIWLESATGDAVQLANGDVLAGVVDQARYEIRTPDGQMLAFSRHEVQEILFHQPAKPGAAAPGAPVAAAPPAAPPAAPGAPAAAPTVSAAALPPPVRAVLRDLHFEFDRWDLTPEARRTLEDVATAMKAYTRLSLLIEGHADERGTPEYNLALGARRAQAAKDYLTGLGVEPGRLDTISYGEERPLDPRHNEVAWTLNRRAHFAVKSQ